MRPLRPFGAGTGVGAGRSDDDRCAAAVSHAGGLPLRFPPTASLSRLRMASSSCACSRFSSSSIFVTSMWSSPGPRFTRLFRIQNKIENLFGFCGCCPLGEYSEISVFCFDFRTPSHECTTREATWKGSAGDFVPDFEYQAGQFAGYYLAIRRPEWRPASCHKRIPTHRRQFCLCRP